MNCEEVRALVDALPFDEWRPHRRELAEQHARSCASCEVLLASEEQWELELQGMPDPAPPPSLIGSVLTRIRAIDEERTAAHAGNPSSSRMPAQPATRGDRRLWSVAAGAAAGVAGGVWSYMSPLVEGQWALDLLSPRTAGWTDAIYTEMYLDPLALVLAGGLFFYLCGISRSTQ